jgi:glycosyltransferase involved in cell wall biosynthesis
MKIQCYMPVLNEADILPHTLRHLHEQGCSVHVIDGWSTDGSYEIARSWQDRTAPDVPNPYVCVERFPATGPSPVQCCTDILHRIEDLAAVSVADWILYSDADEWRRSPHGRETLAEAVTRIDFQGHNNRMDGLPEMDWNAIDFRVFQFYCTPQDAWGHSSAPKISPEQHFHHYDEADCISRIPNRKLWKNVGRVQLAGGGHEVTFPGMRVYPVKFTMKHYPFRTPQQARAKIETRIARRCAEEHAKGWGVHYDQYPPGFDFCWDPAKLKFWKATRSPLP